MNIHIPNNRHIIILLYIICGAVFVAAPSILEHMDFIASAKTLGLLQTIGMLLLFGGLLAAFTQAMDSDTDNKRKK